MPVHDWKKVDAGIVHDFHQAWIIELRNALNDGILPEGFYALAEQVARPFGPDLLTLQETSPEGTNGPAKQAGLQRGGALALLNKAPKVRMIQESTIELYAKKADRIAIRLASDDRVTAFLEVLSPGNKISRQAIDDFLKKIGAAFEQGIHLLFIDLFPPTSRDPHGIHGLIWGDAAVPAPAAEPAHAGGLQHRPAPPRLRGTHGDWRQLIDMPLFLDESHYVQVPLEATYQSAWRGVPGKWKAVLATG